MTKQELLSELQDLKYWIEKDGLIATLDEAISRVEAKDLDNKQDTEREELEDEPEEVETRADYEEAPDMYDDNGGYTN